MSSVIVIPGLSSVTKRPGFFGELKLAQGAITAASIPLILLLVGNKTAAGAMTPDAAPVQVIDADDVDANAGAGSELAVMAYGVGGPQGAGALAVPGVQVWLGCVLEAATSPAAATATVTITGTWAAGGTVIYRISGFLVPVTIGANDSVTAVASSIKNAINGNPRLPFTATNASGVLTITTKNKGPRNNWHNVFQDVTSAPAGFVSTLTGGTSMTGGGVRFHNGVGNDDPTLFQAAIFPSQYNRIALACADSTLDGTQLALWKTQINLQAAPTVGILQQVEFASSDTLTNAASLSQTTLNDGNFSINWALNIPTPACQIAGTVAAMRCATEQTDPDAAYDNEVIPGVVGQVAKGDFASAPTQETALGEGVTPLLTNTDGTVSIGRKITTRCLFGSSPDYRVLDTTEPTVGQHILFSAELLWTTDFQPANPRVRADPAPEEPLPPEGVGHPSLWTQAVTKMLRNMEEGVGYPEPIITDVDDHLPTGDFDSSAKRIMSVIPYATMPNNHSIGVSVRQMNTV